jgi:hypothetical protein
VIAIRRPWILAAALVGCADGKPHDAPATSPPLHPAPVPRNAAPRALAIGPGASSTDVSSIVGKPAPAWDLRTWFNSPPRRIEDLRGQVVLVRWFMSAECPYCSATAPSLVALQ